MYTLIRYPVAGIIVEALTWRVDANRMRAAVAGLPDTFDLTRSGTQWITDTGQPVEIEFLLASGGQGEAAPFGTLTVVVRAAGSPVS